MAALELVKDSAGPLTSANRHARIIQLARAASEGAETVRRQQKKCVSEAVECGQLLLQEKHFNASKGRWQEYFAIHFGAHLPERTARLWMALAKKHAENPALPEANLMRNGILALDLMPTKEHAQIPNNPTVMLRNNHMAGVMRVEQWFKHFEAHELSKASPAYLKRLGKDFAKLAAHIGRLHAAIRAASD